MEELLVAALHDEEMIIMELWVALDVLVSIPTAQIASTEVTLPTDDNGNIPILKRKKCTVWGFDSWKTRSRKSNKGQDPLQEGGE